MDENEWARIARYAMGQCSADEADELSRWISSNPERQEAAAFIRDLESRISAFHPEWDTIAAWRRLTARRHARSRERATFSAMRSEWHASRHGRSRLTVRRVALRIAAVFVLAAAASGLSVWGRARLSMRPAAREIALREVSTNKGQRASLSLADGSRIILAPASHLRYAADFGPGSRDVYLDGEAYFQVVHDAQHPFIVHTATAVTRDIGTKFIVHQYGGDTTVRVVVAQGSVELRADQLPAGRRGAVLIAGQMGRLARNGITWIQPVADVARYLAWTDGRLVFDDTPLGQAVPQLERWYDIEISLTDSSLEGRRLSGSFKDEPVSEVMQNIAFALDLHVEHQGHVIILAPKRVTH